MTVTEDAKFLRYVCDVADALSAVASGELGYGNAYVSEVRFGFDGEDTRVTLIPNDTANGYDVRIKP